jgi:hypothetical protein
VLERVITVGRSVGGRKVDMEIDAAKVKLSNLSSELTSAEKSGDVGKARVLRVRIENLKTRIRKSQDEGDWFCDGCKRTIKVGDKRYDCVECPDEFTFCKKCFLTKDHMHRLRPTINVVHLSRRDGVNEHSGEEARDSGMAYESSLITIDQRIEKLKESLLESDDDGNDDDGDDDSVKEESEDEQKREGSSQHQPECYVCNLKFTGTKQLNEHVAGIRHKEAVTEKFAEQYVPSNGKAMYCRVCRVGFCSVEDLMKHRDTSTHLNIKNLEREASFCQVCKKQFTSVYQLNEHYKGKAHQEKREERKRGRRFGSRDGPSSKRFRGGRGGRGLGRGGRGRGRGRGGRGRGRGRGGRGRGRGNGGRGRNRGRGCGRGAHNNNKRTSDSRQWTR